MSTNGPEWHGGEWWSFDGADPGASWRTASAPILDSLIEKVPASVKQRPWVAGHALQIRGFGGLVSKERRRYTIVGNGEYTSYVAGSRTLVAGEQTVAADTVSTIVAQQNGADEDGVPWGRDSLTVLGNADVTVGSRTVLMSGIVQRSWNGGVMRLASMEGIICGGAFLRLIAGPSATLSALCTGDVYGGCARVAVVRTYLAVLQYRAAAVAAWAVGIYLRSASFVIEPIIGIPTSGGPVSNTASKLARLGRVLSAARMLCPPLDIFIGVATFVPLGIYGLYKLISGIVKKPVPVPPAGPPRVRIRNVALSQETFGMMTVM